MSWLNPRRPKKTHPWPPNDSRYLRLVKADNYEIVRALTGLTREQQNAILRGEVACEPPRWLSGLPGLDRTQGFAFLGKP